MATRGGRFHMTAKSTSGSGSTSTNDDMDEDGEVVDAMDVEDKKKEPRVAGRAIVSGKRRIEIVGTRFLTSQERLRVYSQMPRLGNKTIVPPSAKGESDKSQDIYQLLRTVGISLQSGKKPFTVPFARELAKRFLLGDSSLAEHNKNVRGRGNVVRDTITTLYNPDNSKPVDTSTFSAPRLHFGKLARSDMQKLIDWNERIVVKMYRFDNFVGDANQSMDLVTDIVVSAVMSHLLVFAYPKVVSPHMAFLFDSFQGPEIKVTPDRAGSVPNVNVLPFVSAQYVVVERADKELQSLTSEGLLSPRALRSVLWQVLYTLESANDVARYRHNDFHTGNVMVRLLANEPTSMYLNTNWLYMRSAGHSNAAAHVVIPASEHGNYFVEIIDNGRARAYCPIYAPDTEPRNDARVLFGNPAYEHIGIYVDDARSDRSYDVRRLFYYVLINYNINAQAKRAKNPGDLAVCDGLKELLVTGSNLVAFARYLIASEATIRSSMLSQQIFIVARFYEGMKEVKKLLRAPSRSDTAVISRELVFAMYEGLVVPMQSNEYGKMRDYLCDTFLTMTVSPMLNTGGGGVVPTARNTNITPTLCLDMALFAELAVAKVGPADVLVGMVHPDWERRTDPAKKRTADELEDTSPGAADSAERKKKRARFGTGFGAADGNMAEEVPVCATCARDARGYMVDPATQRAMQHAFCSAVCMEIHTGTIVAARPF